MRKNRKNRMQNLDIKTDLKKTLKTFVATVTKKEGDAAEKLKTVYKKLDKAAKRNILHKNTVARRKSRLSRMLNSSKSA